MKAAVWQVGTWKTSKFGDEWGSHLNLVIVFKGLEPPYTDKTFKANLGENNPQKDTWLRIAKEGTNVTGLDLQPNGKNVNIKHVPTVSRVVKTGKEAVDEFGQLPGQLELI